MIQAITNVQIVGIGKNFDTIRNGTIRFNTDCILSIEEGVKTKESDHVIDGTGLTVLPGLMDCHVHLGMDCSADPFKQIEEDNDATTALRAISQGQEFIKHGITTVRNVGTKNNVDVWYREAIKEGIVSGPNIVASGMPIVITGGHGYCMAIEVDGIDEVKKAVRSQIKAGVDLLKVMATGGVLTKGNDPGAVQMEFEEIKSACIEAKKVSKTVAAHAIGVKGIKNAINAGVTTIEHGTFLDDEALKLMLKNGTFLVPTLLAANLLLQNKSEKIPKYMIEKVETMIDQHKKSFQKAINVGIKIAAGTDAGTPFNYPGLLVEELKLMIEAGMTELEAIKSATYNAARAMKIENERGSIEVGLIADLILVKGDPLKNINNLKNILQVYQNGKLIVENQTLKNQLTKEGV